MAFEVEHDWQASLATPRPRVGERVKTNLLLLLCALWIFLGLVGHHPWKPDEAQSISAVKHILEGGSWVVPAIAGDPNAARPPLYYLTAAGSAALLSPWLPMHDAARLVTGLWLALTLFMVGLTGREMWGVGEGRLTALIFLGSIGLIYSAHLLTPEVAGLAGYAMTFYGLALARRRPWRAALLIGSGLGIALLSTGLLPIKILLATALMLLLFPHWRRKSYLASLGTGLVIACVWFALWLVPLWLKAPHLIGEWLEASMHLHGNLMYFVKTLTWFAWPALPLAAWSLWHFRHRLWQRPQFQLTLMLLLAMLLMLGMGAKSRDILAMPLLLPIAVMGAAAVEELRRGAASALDWFGIMLFGTIAFLVWLGWFAMMTGFPAKLAERMRVLSEAYVPRFDWPLFLVAVVLILLWLFVVIKAKRSNRTAVTDWAVGSTMVWGLLMTLWLPWLDAAKGYHLMFADMAKQLPAEYSCVATRGVGGHQRALLHYYLDIRSRLDPAMQRLECDLYLLQDHRKPKLGRPGPEWKLIWQGHRPSDRHERFFLYRYQPD